jgi:hypothetical protein
VCDVTSYVTPTMSSLREDGALRCYVSWIGDVEASVIPNIP